MRLMAMLEEALNRDDATDTVATSATHSPEMAPTVASVAIIAVADSPKLKNEQADLSSSYVVNTEYKSALYNARLLSFRNKGITDDAAGAIAKQLTERDNNPADDRRSCAECDSFYADRCKRHRTLIGELSIYTLHRCKGFTE